MLARSAIAPRIERPRITRVDRLLDRNSAFTGKSAAVAPIAGWHYAIEQIKSHRDRRKDIGRCAHSHKVTRSVCGKHRCRQGSHLQHRRFRLSDGQTADRKAVEWQSSYLSRTAAPQVGKDTALDDAE